MIAEYKKFRQWEQSEYPYYDRFGEWEVQYPDWDHIYSEFDRWLKFSSENEKDYDAVLFLIARDNEDEVLSEKLTDFPDIALKLAKYSITTLNSDAKWQLAKIIAKIPGDEIDTVIFKLSIDRSYYVQRICMMESAKRKSQYAKEMVEWSWETHEEYLMISALWSLHYLDDRDLDRLLERAMQSNIPFLINAANEIRAIRTA
jgi:hypothetical protein